MTTTPRQDQSRRESRGTKTNHHDIPAKHQPSPVILDFLVVQDEVVATGKSGIQKKKSPAFVLHFDIPAKYQQ